MSADHIHAFERPTLGHKGLFLDRLDLANPLGPQLVPFAQSMYHNRNRAYVPQMGRFLQQDPNQSAMSLIAASPFHGRGAGAIAAAFSLDGLYGDGANLYHYLGSNPWMRNDPTGLSWDPLAGLERPYEEHERLRLWRTRSPSRDPRSIRDGGDYIPPGVWIPLETFGLVEIDSAGVARPAPDVTLWVEAVMPSGAVGDAPVQARLSRGIAGSMQAHDGVRVTATEVVLLGDNNQSEEMLPSGVALRSDLNAEDENEDAYGEGQYVRHRIRILDPRSTSYMSDTVDISGFALPLTAIGSGLYESVDFRLADVAGLQPSATDPWVVPSPAVGVLGIEYNPAASVCLVLGTSTSYFEPLENRICKAIDEITGAMKAAGWTPDNPADPGAYGKEVHRRVTSHFAGNQRVRSGMLVDMETRQIVTLEGYNGAGHGTTVQCDLVVMKSGYNPQQGDILDPDRCSVVDVKTSVDGDIRPQQRERLRRVWSRQKIYYVNPQHRWTASASWHINSKWKVAFGVASIFGVANAAWVILQPDQYNSKFEDIERAYLAHRNDPDDEDKMMTLGETAVDLYRTLTGDMTAVVNHIALIHVYSGIN